MEISYRLVEEALEHLWDYSYLGAHPLASRPFTRSYLANGKGRETHIDRGMALSRLLQSLLFEITATDMATYVAISLLLLFISVIACVTPARRAAAIDPVHTLKVE